MEVTSLPYFHFPPPGIYLLSIQQQAVEIKVVLNKMSFEHSVAVGFMNQTKLPIERCDSSSQSIFVKKSRDRLGKKRAQNNKYQIVTNRRNGRTRFVSSETQEHQISIMILVLTLYGFNLILQLLLVKLQSVLSDNREQHKGAVERYDITSSFNNECPTRSGKVDFVRLIKSW